VATQARYEPPFLSPHRMQLSDWGPLLGALESLIMRCAALESILESDEPLLHQTQLADTLGESIRVWSPDPDPDCGSSPNCTALPLCLPHLDPTGGK